MSNGPLIGAAGFAGSLLAGVPGQVQGKRMQKRAQKYTKRNMLKGPSWQVEGLERAGINPVLAFASGGNPTNSVAGATGSPQGAQDAMGGAEKAAGSLLKSQLKSQSKAQVGVMDSQKFLNQMNAEVAKLEAQSKALSNAREGIGMNMDAARAAYYLHDPNGKKEFIRTLKAQGKTGVGRLIDTMAMEWAKRDKSDANAVSKARIGGGDRDFIDDMIYGMIGADKDSDVVKSAEERAEARRKKAREDHWNKGRSGRRARQNFK